MKIAGMGGASDPYVKIFWNDKPAELKDRQGHKLDPKTKVIKQQRLCNLWAFVMRTVKDCAAWPILPQLDDAAAQDTNEGIAFVVAFLC